MHRLAPTFRPPGDDSTAQHLAPAGPYIVPPGDAAIHYGPSVPYGELRSYAQNMATRFTSMRCHLLHMLQDIMRVLDRPLLERHKRISGPYIHPHLLCTPSDCPAFGDASLTSTGFGHGPAPQARLSQAMPQSPPRGNNRDLRSRRVHCSGPRRKDCRRRPPCRPMRRASHRAVVTPALAERTAIAAHGPKSLPGTPRRSRAGISASAGPRPPPPLAHAPGTAAGARVASTAMPGPRFQPPASRETASHTACRTAKVHLAPAAGRPRRPRR